MTRFLLRFVSMLTVGCGFIVFVALLIGQALPPEDEIVFNGKVSFSLIDSNIYRMSVERRMSAPLTHDLAAEWLVGWSHDGQQIAFVRENATGSSIYLMNAEGRELQRLVTTPSRIVDAIWSPDNQYMAYTRMRDAYPQLMLINLRTLSVHPLGDELHVPNNAVWSPDGTQIIFTSGISDRYNNNIYAATIENGALTFLGHLNPFDSSQTWFLDGTEMTYVAPVLSNSQSEYVINRVDLQNGTVQPFVKNAMYPMWSPNRNYLVYISSDNGRPNSLNLLEVESGKHIQLYVDPIEILYRPTWSPDGKSVVFGSFNPNSPSPTLYQLNIADCLQNREHCTPNRLTYGLAFSDNAQWRPHQP